MVPGTAWSPETTLLRKDGAWDSLAEEGWQETIV